MRIDNTIFNTLAVNFGISELSKYQNFNLSRTPENLSMQRLALKKWQEMKTEFNRRKLFSRDELSAWQLKQVSWLVDFAFMNVPFYQNLYSNVGYEIGAIRSWLDFEKLPIIDKDLLLKQDPGNLLSPGTDYSSSPGIRTSGSSGNFLTVILNNSRIYWDYLERLRMYELMFGNELLPEQWIYSLDNSKWWLSSLDGNHPTYFVKTNADLKIVKAHIIKLKPKIVSGVAHTIIDLLKNFGPELSPYVQQFSTHSEASSFKVRRDFELELGVCVKDEYSSEELGLIAYECSENRYHLIEDSVYVEVDKSKREIIGTELWNTGMPTIRYRQGDLSTISGDSECACGCNFRLLDDFFGRADQSLWSTEKGWINPMKIVELADLFLSCEGVAIENFRVRQKSKKLVVIEFFSKSPTENTYKNLAKFKNELSKLIGSSMTIFIDEKKKFAEHKNHKRQTVFNDVFSELRNRETQ